MIVTGISAEQADEVRYAFGTCSQTLECMETEEVQEHWASYAARFKNQPRTIGGWLKQLFTEELLGQEHFGPQLSKEENAQIRVRLYALHAEVPQGARTTIEVEQ